MTRFLLLVLALPGCTRYAPPEWLQGEWTTASDANDTAWFEWDFTDRDVVRREFLNTALEDSFSLREIGVREDESTDETYTLSWPLTDAVDAFLRTDDPDIVGWRAEGPHVVSPSVVDMHRLPSF